MNKVGAPKKRYCLRGHDTWAIGGRYKSGACKECSYEKNRERRELDRIRGRLRWQRPRPGMLPTRRLRQRTTRVEATMLWSSRNDVHYRTGQRQAGRLFTNEWLPYDLIDEWCCVLGTHLAIVYPECYTDQWRATA